MGIKRRSTMLGAATTALVLGVSSPALAGVDRTVRTSDDNPGGTNSWISSGDNFKVCDVQQDGLRVVGWAWRQSGSDWILLGSREESRGNGNCTTWDGATLPSGTPIRIRVCLKDGPDGANVFCATRSDAEA